LIYFSRNLVKFYIAWFFKSLIHWNGSSIIYFPYPFPQANTTISVFYACKTGRVNGITSSHPTCPDFVANVQIEILASANPTLTLRGSDKPLIHYWKTEFWWASSCFPSAFSKRLLCRLSNQNHSTNKKFLNNFFKKTCHAVQNVIKHSAKWKKNSANLWTCAYLATHNGVVKELVLCSVAIKSLYILAKKPFSIFEVLKLVFVL
jgi:hypothetical protein